MAARYEALLKLASGGMASVWIGTARGALGFRQLVAIKKPHPHLLESPGFKDELIAEARLASMIRHANVVDVRDVEVDGDSLSLVMDFIEGASLGELLVAASRRPAADPRIPARVAVRILRDACAGLHAAHELVDERSRPVGLVHRDVSPQNILVGEDGIARVTDFGVAKFAKKNAMQSTSDGSLKGKLAYMAPEYLRGEAIDRRFDVFAAGVVLWEALTGKRCFRADSEAETMRRILDVATPRVSTIDPRLAPLDDVLACALEKAPGARFQNAAAMGAALEATATEAGLLGSHTEVAETLKELVGAKIEERRAQVRTKLAHEPSLASLGAGALVMSPLAPSTRPEVAAEERHPSATVTAAAPRTERTAPPTHADTPRLGTVEVPATRTSGPPTAASAPPTVTTSLAAPPAATVPNAAPLAMATRVDGGPFALAATRHAVDVAPPAPLGATQRSADPVTAPAPVGSGELPSHGVPTPRGGGDATHHAIAVSATTGGADAVPAPPTRSLAPIVVGGAAVLAIAVAAFAVVTRREPTASSGAASASASVAGPPASAAPSAPSSVAAPRATDEPDAAAPAEPAPTRAASTAPAPAPAPRTRSPAPSPAPAPPPAVTSARPRRPPANPYE